MRARYAGMSHLGLVRDHNEDAFLNLPEHNLVVVADGMGGHRSGDVASTLAISTIESFFRVTVSADATWPFPTDPNLSDEENYLVTGIRLANRRIYERAARTVQDFGMGTTIVAAILSVERGTITIGHVGDSRCYRIRGEEIAQLTRDHSLVSDATHLAPWMSPEELRQLPSNVITRALGIREDVLVDLFTDKLLPGDTYLLCSDGLSGMVSDDQIQEIVASVVPIEEACDALIQRANFFGGTDNITVVLARVEDAEGENEATAPGLR